MKRGVVAMVFMLISTVSMMSWETMDPCDPGIRSLFCNMRRAKCEGQLMKCPARLSALVPEVWCTLGPCANYHRLASNIQRQIQDTFGVDDNSRK